MPIERSALQSEIDRPLYLQLADLLRMDIAGKRAGDRIDSETKLAEHFGVSRFTVIRAIEILVDEGLIRRRQGLGSFVAPPPLLRAPSYLSSFSEAVAAQGRAASHVVLAFGPVSWREEWPYEKGAALIGLERLRLVDGAPTAIHCSVIAVEIAAEVGLTLEVASAPGFSLYRQFAEAGLAIARGVETLRARAATKEEARLLQLGDDPVVMQVNRNTYDANGRLIDVVDAVYDARRYTYRAEIRRDLAVPAHVGETMEVSHAKADIGGNFGPRLGPWSDDDGDGGGKAGRSDHRPGGPRRSVL